MIEDNTEAQYSEWTVGSLSSVTCGPMFMQFTGCHQPVACVMRNARAHKLQWSDPAVHSSTVTEVYLECVYCNDNSKYERHC